MEKLLFGSSVPELDPTEIQEFAIVRLTAPTESAIADLAEQSSAERARADVLEHQLATEAGALIDRFLAGSTDEFIV